MLNDSETYDNFNRLWRKYRRIVWLMCLSYARGDFALGADYSQECAYMLIKLAKTLRADSGTPAEFKWVMRVVRTTLRKYKYSGHIVTAQLSEAAEIPNPEHSDKARETLKALMAHLDADDRSFLELYSFGYSLNELADFYEISSSEAKRRFARIKQKLIEINQKHRYYEH